MMRRLTFALVLASLAAAGCGSEPATRDVVAAAVLVPAEVAYFSNTLDTLEFYERWFSGHSNSTSLPTFQSSQAWYVDNVLQATPAELPQSKWMAPVNTALGEMLGRQLFQAMLVPPEGAAEGRFTLLAGTRLRAEMITGVAAREALRLQVPGMSWRSAPSGGWDVHVASADGYEDLYFAVAGGWAVASSSEDVLLDALGRLREGAGDGGSLASSARYQDAITHHPDDLLLYTYTDLDRMTAFMSRYPQGGNGAVAQRLEVLAPYFRYGYWGFGVDVDANRASDVIFFGMDEAEGAALYSALAPVGARTRGLINEETLAYVPFTLALDALGPDGVWAGTNLASGLEQIAVDLGVGGVSGFADLLWGEAALVVERQPVGGAFAVAVPHRGAEAVRAVLDRAAGASGTVDGRRWSRASSGGYRVEFPSVPALNVRVDDEQVWLTAGDVTLQAMEGGTADSREPFASLEAAYGPEGKHFAAMFYDSHRIMGHFQNWARHNWPATVEWLGRKGVAPIPPEAEGYDFSRWFKGASFSSWMEPGGMMVQTQIERGDSVSTGFSALSFIGAQAFADEYETIESSLSRWSALRQGSQSPPTGTFIYRMLRAPHTPVAVATGGATWVDPAIDFLFLALGPPADLMTIASEESR